MFDQEQLDEAQGELDGTLAKHYLKDAEKVLVEAINLWELDKPFIHLVYKALRIVRKEDV